MSIIIGLLQGLKLQINTCKIFTTGFGMQLASYDYLVNNCYNPEIKNKIQKKFPNVKMLS